jgi:hypothetical protein
VSILLRYRHRSRIIRHVDVEDDRVDSCCVDNRHLGADPVDLDRDRNAATGGDRPEAAVHRLPASAGPLGRDDRDEGNAVGQDVSQGGVQGIRRSVIGDRDSVDDFLAVHAVGHAGLQVGRDHAADVHARFNLIGGCQAASDGVIRGLHSVGVLGGVDQVAPGFQPGEGICPVRSGGEGLQLNSVRILELDHHASFPI